MKSSVFLVRSRAQLLQLSGVGDPGEVKMGYRAGNSSSPMGARQRTLKSDMGGSEYVPGFNLDLQ